MPIYKVSKTNNKKRLYTLPAITLIVSGLEVNSPDTPVLWWCDVVVNLGHTDDLNQNKRHVFHFRSKESLPVSALPGRQEHLLKISGLSKI